MDRRRRPPLWAGAIGNNVAWEATDSSVNYSLCCPVCRISTQGNLCPVCTAWYENYRHIQSALKALEAITPRPALRLVKGERRPCGMTLLDISVPPCWTPGLP